MLVYFEEAIQIFIVYISFDISPSFTRINETESQEFIYKIKFRIVLHLISFKEGAVECNQLIHFSSDNATPQTGHICWINSTFH